LSLIAGACGCVLPIDQSAVEPLSVSCLADLRGQPARQLATLQLDNGQVSGSVQIVPVAENPDLPTATGAENYLQIDCRSTGSTLLFGQGAGCWPTTISVVSDLLQLRAIAQAKAGNELPRQTVVS